MKTALILAGHGSHISPETAGLVWGHVDALRALNVADEVTAAFWKEMPSFHTVFDSLEATDITVVPLFTAQGYFTQTVIPTEMGLTGAITHRDGRTIRYARTLSEHPYLGEIVRQRITDVMRTLNTQPDQIAIALIGHSTKRNPESRKATEAQAEAVRQMQLAHEVVAVYLDDTPSIADVYQLTSAPNLIVVPYFLANGSHTTIDVPRELGMDEGNREALINRRHVYYTQPVGIEDDLRNTIIELVREAGADLRYIMSTSAWDHFPTRGLDRLQPLIEAGSGVIGQLRITADDVRHVDDHQPAETITNPDELRRKVRENPFRPLATSTDLPCGWHVPTNGDLQRVQAVIEMIYPGALGSADTPSGSLESLLSRQTGRYQEISQLDQPARIEIVRQVCNNCVRQPAWVSNEVSVKPKPLQCPEPCDVWLSTALKLMKGGAEA
jgi:sirohydrochlorin cobaltochelatase